MSEDFEDSKPTNKAKSVIFFPNELVQQILEEHIRTSPDEKGSRIKLTSDAVAMYATALNAITQELIARSVDWCDEGNELDASHLASVLDIDMCDQEKDEEIEAIECMFDGNEWRTLDKKSRQYEYLYSTDSICGRIKIKLPLMYPLTESIIFSIIGLPLDHESIIKTKLMTTCRENVGRPILFELLTEFKNFIDELDTSLGEDIQRVSPETCCNFITDDHCKFEIFHGEPITDRKSVFQAHAAKVKSREDVRKALEQLLSDKKVASALHNMYAYRIESTNGAILEDCEDDGETAAGSRMAHLLNIMDVRNVLVVVSRWYGGIKLGPDRFKHVNNCTRNVLIEHCFKNDGCGDNNSKTRDSCKKGSNKH